MAAASDSFTVVVTGDAILNQRLVAEDEGFEEVRSLLQGADVLHTQMETLLHDFDGPGIYPAVEGAWGWMRGPGGAADDLRDLGVNLVSTASNHSLDYSYGGLESTWRELDRVGLVHAGTGRTLAAARMPAYLDTAHGKVALISACSSFPLFARAGEQRRDLGGRPGLNPLGWFHQVDARTADQIITMSARLGLWVTKLGDEFVVNPPGIHNTLTRYLVGDDDVLRLVPDPDDLAGNLAAVDEAARHADVVLVHLHAHEWDIADGSMSTSPYFVELFARQAIEHGAHVVVVQGSHAPMRGLEIHHGRPIFYDPGDLFRMGRSDRVPSDFYTRWGYGPAARRADATPADAYEAREAVFGWGDGDSDPILSPRDRYSADPGFVLPEITMGPDYQITEIKLTPGHWLKGRRIETGLPVVAHGSRADDVLIHLEQLSKPYGTQFVRDGDTATVRLPPDDA